MKPFNYEAPRTISEAVALLARHGNDARPLAGGTDLLVQMRAGRLAPTVLVDIKGIPETSQLSWDPMGALTIGSAVPLYRVYEDPRIRSTFPCLVDAASIIGGVAIQGRATLGGNLCNSAPSGDSIPALIVLGAACIIAGQGGNREILVEQFCVSPGRSSLRTGEMLAAIRIPAPIGNSGARYLRFTRRNEMDIAVVGAGAALVLSPGRDVILEARIALGAVSPTPLLASRAGDSLAGRIVSESAFATAARIASEEASPIDDMRGAADQRRHLVAVLVQRALRGAAERAGIELSEVGRDGR